MQPYPHRNALKRKPLARIRKKKKLAYMYVNPATLAPLYVQARDVVSVRALRQPLREEQISVRSLPKVTTLVLLGVRAKTVRTTYKRHWECIANLKPRKSE